MPTVLERLGSRGFKAQVIPPVPTSQYLIRISYEFNRALFLHGKVSFCPSNRQALLSFSFRQVNRLWIMTRRLGEFGFNLTLLKNFSHLLGLSVPLAHPSINSVSGIIVGHQPSCFVQHLCSQIHICMGLLLRSHIIMSIVFYCSFSLLLHSKTTIYCPKSWIPYSKAISMNLPKSILETYNIWNIAWFVHNTKKAFSNQNIFISSVGKLL